MQLFPLSNRMGLWAKAGEQAATEYRGKDKNKLALLQKRIYGGLRRKAGKKAMKTTVKATKAMKTMTTMKAKK